MGIRSKGYGYLERRIGAEGYGYLEIRTGAGDCELRVFGTRITGFWS